MDISGISDKIDLTEGQWVDGIPQLPGVQFLVRSANYKPYARARDRALRDAAPDMATDDGEEAFWLIIGAKMAEHLILDWKGVTSGGKPSDFTAEAAMAILTADDPHAIGYRFRRGVDYASSVIAARHAARTDALVKN